MIPILSIITPIYNGATHINKFFDNIGRIEDGRVEFILINDGSIDGTDQIIKTRLKMFGENYIYISQNNTGAAGARFNGISRANGDYIALLDCDDELGPRAIEIMLKKIGDDGGNADCILFNLKYKKNNRISDFVYSIKKWPVTGIIAFSETIDKWGLHGFGAFRKSVYISAYAALVKLTSLSSNQVNDDELITRLAFYNSKTIDFCDGIYFYNIGSNSTTRGYNKNGHRMLYTSINLVNFITNEVKSTDLLQKAFQNLLNHTLAIHRTYIANFAKIKNKQEWITSITSAVIKLRESDQLFLPPSGVKELLIIGIKKIHWLALDVSYQNH